MMAHELLGKDFDGNVLSLGVFDTEEFAAHVRHHYETEGDEFAAFFVRETVDEDPDVVFLDPTEDLDRDIEFLNETGVHISGTKPLSDETIRAIAATVRCIRDEIKK